MLAAVRTKRFVPKPANAQADPRFQKVKGKVGQKAAQLRKHPTAKLKAFQAAKAAKPPANAQMSGAKEKQVAAMKDAKAAEVKKDSFLELLRAEIKKVMPSTLDDADNFMEGGKEGEMKSAVSGKVNQQKGEAESQIKGKTNEKPSTAGVEVKPVEEIPADPATPVPSVNAAEAMPAPRTNEEISQEQSKLDADRQLKDAEVTETQLKKANEPRFTEVLTAKKEVETVADASPARYKAGEKTLLGRAASAAQSDGKRGLFALAGVKTKSGSAVKARQLAAKAKDELARKQVADNIAAMYDDTKRVVELKLNLLESSVTSMFDKGSTNAIAKMKSDTEREIDEFKDDRYSGIGGKLDWIADLFRAAPEGIKKIIKRNLDIFTATMDALVVQIADNVETRLKDIKNEIDKGQLKIKNYVLTLKGDLAKVGKAAEQEVAGRFDEMRAGVDERKNALATKLAARYKEATDKANTLAADIESANEGAAYKLAKKLAEIAKLILDFKDKLVSILKKAVAVILDILSDPIGFFGNLIDAVGLGFKMFKDNFASNFKKAIAGWLFGALGSVGFELPKDLSPGSIVKLVMGIAGLTKERLRAKAVTLLGERAVGLLEELYKYVDLLINGTPEELWAKVKEDLGSMEEMVIGGIKKWLMTSLVEAGIQKLLTMVIPGAGFIQAALAIYKLVVFLIQRAAQIAAFISSVVDSVADIVKGNITAAAKRVEQALIQAMSLIIDLLARLLGLGGIADTIKSLIKKVQDMVGLAIDKVLGKIVQSVKKMFGKGGKDTGKEKDSGSQKRLNDAVAAVAQAMRAPKATVSTVEEKLPEIKKTYGLTSLKLAQDKKGVRHVEAVINPSKRGDSSTLFTTEELKELTETAKVYAAKIKKEKHQAVFLANPTDYLTKKLTTGTMVEAAGVEEVAAHAKGLTVLRNVELKFADASGITIGGQLPELDFLVLGTKGVQEIVSAKLKPKRFKANEDRALLKHFQVIPLTPPAITTYADTHFGVNKKFKNIQSVNVTWKGGKSSLDSFRASYLSKVVVDTIVVTSLTPGPDRPVGVQLVATEAQLLEKTIELIKSML
jgi:uncharacterized protein YdcH (DUF465 family)